MNKESSKEEKIRLLKNLIDFFEEIINENQKQIKCDEKEIIIDINRLFEINNKPIKISDKNKEIIEKLLRIFYGSYLCLCLKDCSSFSEYYKNFKVYLSTSLGKNEETLISKICSLSQGESINLIHLEIPHRESASTAVIYDLKIDLQLEKTEENKQYLVFKLSLEFLSSTNKISEKLNMLDSSLRECVQGFLQIYKAKAFKDTINLYYDDLYEVFTGYIDQNINKLMEYYNQISQKLKDFEKLKEEIENFLAKDVLKKISKEYEKKANDHIKFSVWEGKSFIFPKWSLFFLLSLLFIITPIFGIPKLLNGQTWHDILIKVSIGFIPIIVGFYLLRYSLKLRDLQEEYKFKSIMLSSLPALSILIDDKNERDKIITTILLEASNLQTLTKDKGEIVKEILPIVELANKLKNS